ncbi:aldo/keto reductase [Christensenella intestinihominis]|uniref:aldo/keto reductase n=1 Tax=Christensenella intestinihominis TaxID=1851429 RepID=UPI0009F73DC3|nr:aldo/keto reductase [Christensenella intestinihominis]
MNYFKLRTTDTDVSVMALGCWVFGGGDYWGNNEDDAESLRTIDKALELGINFFDTADSYGDGHSDEVLGRAMKGRRGKFFVASKAYLDQLGEKNLTETVERGLKRMGTDYIDLFYPHFASREIPFEETFGTLLKLQKQGKIRAIGMSNFGVKSIRRVAELGLMDKIAIHQLPYSLLWRAIEFGIQQETAENGVGIICYSTLAQGLLSGNFAEADDVPSNLKVLRFFDSARVEAGHGEKGCEKETFRAIRDLKELCADAGVTMPAASLAWLFLQPDVQCVLTGPRCPQRLLENVEALETKVSPAFGEQLSAATDRLKICLGKNPDMWMSEKDSRFF